MNVPFAFLAESQMELFRLWGTATLEGKIIIVVLLAFSIFAWSIMASKAVQMAKAKKMNSAFDEEYRRQKNVLAVFDRNLDVEGCPIFTVYQQGCTALDHRLRMGFGEGRRKQISLTGMEHIKRGLEGAVAKESLKLESGLILLALAVSGAPFLGLLGTVWGVMSAFSHVAMLGKADLQTLAPGVAAALITTVAGLLVAIPSMFGYNWLVHNLRVMTVDLDNFAQDLVSRMENEYLAEDGRN